MQGKLVMFQESPGLNSGNRRYYGSAYCYILQNNMLNNLSTFSQLDNTLFKSNFKFSSTTLAPDVAISNIVSLSDDKSIH